MEDILIPEPFAELHADGFRACYLVEHFQTLGRYIERIEFRSDAGYDLYGVELYLGKAGCLEVRDVYLDTSDLLAFQRAVKWCGVDGTKHQARQIKGVHA